MNSINKTARMAGLLYLGHFVTFFLADNGVHYTAVEPIDGAAIAHNMMASERLFRIGFVSFLFAAVFFLLSAWALYVLLKPVNKDLALLFVLLNLGGVAIHCISQISEFGAMLLLSGTDYLQVFQADQLQALAMLFLNLYKNGFMIAQIFLGLWLLPLGYLVFKSGFLPRILGILLIIDCFAMLTWFFQFFFFPGYEVISNLCLAEGFLAEGSLCLWLLIKGAKDKEVLV
ncbi:MAG: DUF4386 domain-containing protein [Chloroflexi bacterium]|nr:DUF4386 domain-containing protein [Chloroflexota bacterium]